MKIELSILSPELPGKTLDAFEVQLRRMAGLEDGIVDALFRFSRPINGAYYWCPPIRNKRLDLESLNTH